MCGRFLLLSEEDLQGIWEIIMDWNNRDSSKIGEIYPTDAVPIIVNENKATLAKWGFPRFNGPGQIINARSETIAEKPTFRNAFQSRRCLIPAHGFFEWTKEGNHKTKYLIRVSDQPMFYMAGLYNTFTDKNKESYPGFVVITVQANKAMAQIHDRMPLILRPSDRKLWLNNEIHDTKIFQEMLRPYDNNKMILEAVS